MHGFVTRRVGHSVSERSPVAGSNVVERQQSVPQDDDDDAYSSVDDVQPQMFALSDNPAYELVSEYRHQPLQAGDDEYEN